MARRSRQGAGPHSAGVRFGPDPQGWDGGGLASAIKKRAFSTPPLDVVVVMDSGRPAPQGKKKPTAIETAVRQLIAVSLRSGDRSRFPSRGRHRLASAATDPPFHLGQWQMALRACPAIRRFEPIT